MVSGQDLPFWQEAFVKFYQAFIEADRWKQYLQGVGTTVMITIMALGIGIVLGVMMAMVRTTHDQQRPGTKKPLLSILNTICKTYITIIRGTPMMVQLLIMSMVIFSSSRNYTMVGALTLGLNSGAYVAEIIRGGLMALDPGQMEAGRSLGLGYWDTMRFVVGKELVHAAQGIITRTYEQMYPLLGVAVIYLILVMFLTKLLNILERRLQQGDRH